MHLYDERPVTPSSIHLHSERSHFASVAIERRRRRKTRAMIAAAPTATPTPRPALAAVEGLSDVDDDEAVSDGADVDAGAEVEVGALTEDVALGSLNICSPAFMKAPCPCRQHSMLFKPWQ